MIDEVVALREARVFCRCVERMSLKVLHAVAFNAG